MLIEYFEGYKRQNPYIRRKEVQDFEAYLIDEDICLRDAYVNIRPFVETLPIKVRTRKNYVHRLKVFLQYVYDLEGFEVVEEGTFYSEPTHEPYVYLLHKDGSYEGVR